MALLPRRLRSFRWPSRDHIVDPSVVLSTSKDLWDGDALEIFIAPPSSTGYDGHYGTSTSGGPIQVIVSPPGGTTSARAGVFLDYPMTGVIQSLPSDQYTVRDTSDGYAIELRLPWGTGQTPQSGNGVAFDFAVDVTDDPAAGHRQLQGVLNQTFVDGSELCGMSANQAALPACDVRAWCMPTLQ
jgi:hypothetical protein